MGKCTTMGWGWRLSRGKRLSRRRPNPGLGRAWHCGLSGLGHLRAPPQHSHLGVSLENLLAVGGLGKFRRQIGPGEVAGHVLAPFPEAAVTDIIDPAPVGDVDRPAAGAVKLSQFFQSEFFQVLGQIFSL